MAAFKVGSGILAVTAAAGYVSIEMEKAHRKKAEEEAKAA